MVHALVNNAGMLEIQMRLTSMSAERLQRIFSTNIIGSFLCAREAVRRMSTLHGGKGGATEEVATAIMWLLSAEASYATGTATVDLGGGNYGDTSEFAQNVVATLDVLPNAVNASPRDRRAGVE